MTDIGDRYQEEVGAAEDAMEALYPEPGEQPEQEPEQVEQVQTVHQPPPTETATDDWRLTAAEIAERDQIRDGAAKLDQFDQALCQKYGVQPGASEQDIRNAISQIEDKDRAAALRTELGQELRQRQDYLQRLEAAGQQWQNKVRQRHQTETQTRRQQTHAGERAKLLREAPELRDEKTAKRFAEHLQSRGGWTAQEIRDCLDARRMIDAYKAWKAEHPDEAPKLTVPRKAGKSSPPTGSVTGSVTRDARRARGDDPVSILYGEK